MHRLLAVQEVTAGSYEDAFKAAGIDAGKPGWHEFDILKYVKNTRPGKELGLNVDSAHPTNYLFTSSEKNSWGNNRSYVIAPGSCHDPLEITDKHSNSLIDLGQQCWY